MDNLSLIENLVRMCPDSKAECLALKMDERLDKLVLSTDKKTQPKLYEQASTVLGLLKDNEFQDLDEHETEHIAPKPRPSNTLTVQEKDSSSMNDHIPMDIQRFLKQGRILRVFGEDGVCRSMHFFLSKDLTDIKCKHPKENFVKQKWIIPIHQVKEIRYGYDKKSPIAKSGSLFNKPPTGDKCFAVYGPIELEGNKNFHCVCANSLEAKKMFDYLTMVHQEYKRVLAQNLKRPSFINK